VSATAAPSRARHHRIQFTPRGAILALVVTALLFYLVVPLRTYIAQRDRLNQLERQSQILTRQNSDLQAQVRRLGDPTYIERVARECLGMVRAGEIPFVVVRKSGPPAPPPSDC
jgi:cell division protein FtsB